MTKHEIFDNYCEIKDIKIDCFQYAEMIINNLHEKNTQQTRTKHI